MHQPKIHSKLIGPGLFILSGVFYGLLIDPHNAPLLFLLLPFVWLFTLFYWVLRYLLGMYYEEEQRSKAKISSLSIASVLTVVIVLQTLHQLSVKDFVIALGFGALTTWYIRRFNRAVEGEASFALPKSQGKKEKIYSFKRL